MYKYQLGRSGVRWTPEQEQRLRELMQDENLTFSDIAKILGKKTAGVATKANLLGIPYLCKSNGYRETVRTPRPSPDILRHKNGQPAKYQDIV